MGKNKTDNMEIMQFTKVLLIVIVIVVGIYFFTRAFITKDLFKDSTDDNTSKETTEASIDYGLTSLGSLFNRPYTTYYVLAYDETSNDAGYYYAILNNYVTAKSEDDALEKPTNKYLKVYSANLDNPFNANFVAEESTPKATSAADLKVKGPTLIKISKGKIVSFLEDKDSITKELKVD